MLGLSLHDLLSCKPLSFKLFTTWPLVTVEIFTQSILQRPFCPSICRSCCHFSLRLSFNTGGIFSGGHMLHELFWPHVIFRLTMYKRRISNHSMLNSRTSRRIVNCFYLPALASHGHPVTSLHLLHLVLTHPFQNSHLILLFP